MNNDLHFSSKTDNWATPQAFFDKYNAIFNFGLDACASIDNAKCHKFFTIEDNALVQDWTGYGNVWCNPPYGRGIKAWVKKAYESKAHVVMLIPARTDTSWWHDYVMKGQVTFIRGRLKFGDSKNSAPFPSALVVFSGVN